MLPRLPMFPVDVEMRIWSFMPRPSYVQELKRDCNWYCHWCELAFNKKSRNYVRLIKRGNGGAASDRALYFCSSCLNHDHVRSWVRMEMRLRENVALLKMHSYGPVPDASSSSLETTWKTALMQARHKLVVTLRERCFRNVPRILLSDNMNDVNFLSWDTGTVFLGMSDEDVDWQPLFPSRTPRMSQKQATTEFGENVLQWPDWVATQFPALVQAAASRKRGRASYQEDKRSRRRFFADCART